MRAGPWEPVLKHPYRHLVESEAPAQRNGSIRLQSLLGLPVSTPRKRTRGSPLDSLPVLLWFFKLAVFAPEIIDAGVRDRQLTLKIFHLPAELLMARLQILMPRIQIFVVGFKVAQAFTDTFHPVCEVIRYVLLGHTVTSLSLAPPVGVQVLVSLTKRVYHIQLIKATITLNTFITYRCVSCMHV